MKKWSIAFVAMFITGCFADEPTPEVEVRSDAVETYHRDYFEVALDIPGARGDAVRATGTVHFPLRDETTGDPIYIDGRIPARGTCGVTFISPSYAVTAAHCVDDVDVPDPASQSLKVVTYAIDPRIPWDDPGVLRLEGVYPDFIHDTLSPSNGYHTREYTCWLESRCSSLWGSYNCPLPAEDRDRADTAVLFCEDAPACRTGFLNIAETDLDDVEVIMPWTHEVYEIYPDEDEHIHDHYSIYEWFDDGHITENFHYHGDNRNQLLPLISTNFRFGIFDRPRMKLDYAYVTGRRVRFTEINGCHGSSGSGILQQGEFGDWEYLGPVSAGDMGGYPEMLCQSSTAIGEDGLGYARLEYTQGMTEDIDESIIDVCGYMIPDYSLWIEAHAVRIPEIVATADPRINWPFPWPCLTCPQFERMRNHAEPMIRVSPEEKISFEGSTFHEGSTYRFSARVVVEEGTAAIDVYLDGEALMTELKPVFEDGERAGVIAFEFTSPLSGMATLKVVNRSADKIYLTDIVLADPEEARDFDLFEHRIGLTLFEAPIEESYAVPMRIVGDGNGGYAAQIQEKERLAITRLALVAEHNWSINFTADRDEELICGFVLSNGTEITKECSITDGTANLEIDLREYSSVPVAFFLDLPADREPLRIDTFRVW